MSIFNKSDAERSAIQEFRKRYVEHAPCSDGAEAFSKCGSRKDVFRLALSPTGVDFFLKSIMDGWGPSPDDVLSAFGAFVNGRLTVRNENGDRVTSAQMWCGENHITVDDSVRWLVLVGCVGKVEINKWQVVHVFVDSSSRVEIIAHDNSIVYVTNYGGKITGVFGRARINDYSD